MLRRLRVRRRRCRRSAIYTPHDAHANDHSQGSFSCPPPAGVTASTCAAPRDLAPRSRKKLIRAAAAAAARRDDSAKIYPRQKYARGGCRAFIRRLSRTDARGETSFRDVPQEYEVFPVTRRRGERAQLVSPAMGIAFIPPFPRSEIDGKVGAKNGSGEMSTYFYRTRAAHRFAELRGHLKCHATPCGYVYRTLSSAALEERLCARKKKCSVKYLTFSSRRNADATKPREILSPTAISSDFYFRPICAYFI